MTAPLPTPAEQRRLDAYEAAPAAEESLRNTGLHWWADPTRHSFRDSGDRDGDARLCASCGNRDGSHSNKAAPRPSTYHERKTLTAGPLPVAEVSANALLAGPLAPLLAAQAVVTRVERAWRHIDTLSRAADRGRAAYADAARILRRALDGTP